MNDYIKTWGDFAEFCQTNGYRYKILNDGDEQTFYFCDKENSSSFGSIGFMISVFKIPSGEHTKEMYIMLFMLLIMYIHAHLGKELMKDECFFVKMSYFGDGFVLSGYDAFKNKKNVPKFFMDSVSVKKILKIQKMTSIFRLPFFEILSLTKDIIKYSPENKLYDLMKVS